MAGWELDGDGNYVYVDDTRSVVDPPPDAPPPPDAGQATDVVPPPYSPQPAPAPGGTYDPVIGTSPDQYSTSVSASGSGTSQAAIDAHAAEVAGKTAAIDQTTEGYAQGQAQRLWDATQTQGRAIIGDQAYYDAPSEWDVQAQIARRARRGQARLAEAQAQYNQTEALAQRAAEAHVNQVKAQYIGSIQQFAAMRVNPAQWWGNLSSGEQLGTLASVFAANFLGMRGHPTTVMATINQAIDRNMDAQSQNIAHAGEVSSMYKNVYDMVVAESATREEARARMRGYYLAQIQQDITAELARYDAPLAQAKAAEARAALDAAFQKNFADLEATWFDRGMSAKQVAVSAANVRLQAAQKSWAQSQSQSAGVSPRKAGEDPYAKTNWAIDPRTKQVYGVFLEGVGEGAMKEVREKTAAVRSISRKVDQLVQLLDKTNGKVWQGPFQNQIDSETDKRIRALQADIAQEYMKAVQGSRPSDFDFKAALERTTPIPGVTSRAEVVEVLNDLTRRANEAFKDTSSVYVRDFMDPNEAEAAKRIRSAEAGPADDYVAAANAAPREAGPLDDFVGLAHSKQANNAKESPSAGLVDKWAKVRESSLGAPSDPPIWFYAMDEIARNLSHSDEARKQAAQDALDGLAASAAGADDGGQRSAAVKILMEH